ncbi:hypothetical protein [Streptosporangium sp. NPDC003464]
MPYTPLPTPDAAADRAEALRAARRRHHALRAAARGRTTPPPAPAGTDTDQVTEGERQVRLTAQRILTDHLRDERPTDQRSTLPAAPTFWEGMRLDLTGATLIDFNLTRGHVTGARFDEATFTKTAHFARPSPRLPRWARRWWSILRPLMRGRTGGDWRRRRRERAA